MKVWWQARVIICLCAGWLMTLTPAHAQTPKPADPKQSFDYADRFRSECAACHGEDGRGNQLSVPVLAGQHSLYAITQLFLFRERRRNDPGMQALASRMSDDDLRGFSNFIGQLPALPSRSSLNALDAERMQQGRKLANEYKCSFCHGADMAGGQQVPRLAGQREAYLLSSLQGLKAGTRPGYTRAMTEALSQVPVEDFDVLAYYIANLDAK
jgi:cytochrome c553